MSYVVGLEDDITKLLGGDIEQNRSKKHPALKQDAFIALLIKCS
jgi:hypothetical protein